MPSSILMPSAKALRRWCWVHKWTSLVCTLFLLMLCVTGLPLIFHHELEPLFSSLSEPADLPAGTPSASFDRMIETAQRTRPGEFVHLVFIEPGEDERIYIGMGKTPDAPFEDDHGVFVDMRTADLLGQQKFGEGGLLDILFKLHVDMFAGLPGKLFLGVMALLFIIAIVSGLMIYAPFLRDRPFGAVRRDGDARPRWLDLHNLIGIVTLTWALVVGATGMLNTWADLLLKLWQFDELTQMTAPYRGQPVPQSLASFQLAVDAAKHAEPEMAFGFAAFPGTAFAGPHHYAIFMRGAEPFSSRLLKPVLVDAATGEYSDKRDMPWYITALLVSQPLHFGDYGGMPLKILWAILDVLTIIVLGSGLYLWWQRRHLLADPRRASAVDTDPTGMEWQ